jgi:hypothetical protein
MARHSSIPVSRELVGRYDYQIQHGFILLKKKPCLFIGKVFVFTVQALVPCLHLAMKVWNLAAGKAGAD